MATSDAPPKASFTAGFEAIGTQPLLAAYFVAQAIGGVLFWSLLSFPSAHKVFDLFHLQREVTDAFFQADMLVAVAGSALTAWAIKLKSPTAVPLAAFTTGGIVYPTVYLCVWVAHMHTGAADLAVMIPTAILCTWCTYLLWHLSPAGQPASPPARD